MLQVGGVLVGVIGIGIEKILFCLVTWGPRGIHVRDASISSVAVVGWLSCISMIVHVPLQRLTQCICIRLFACIQCPM